jgi:hypothetical protein
MKYNITCASTRQNEPSAKLIEAVALIEVVTLKERLTNLHLKFSGYVFLPSLLTPSFNLLVTAASR